MTGCVLVGSEAMLLMSACLPSFRWGAGPSGTRECESILREEWLACQKTALHGSIVSLSMQGPGAH